jgi:hypothetical protein
MQNDFAFPRDRRVLVLAIGGLHLVAMFVYTPQKALTVQGEVRYLTLVQPPKVHARGEPPREYARERIKRTPSKKPIAPIAPLPDAPAMTVVVTPEAAPEAIPEVAPLENGVTENSSGRAGAIDKELRDKSFFREDRKKLAYQRPKFERMIEDAGKPRGVVVEEIVAPGGRKITRINGKCYYAPHSNNSIMRDPFKSGPPMITQANCPREK